VNRLRQLYGAPSIAVNNWFSDNDTFTSDAGARLPKTLSQT